MVSLPNASFRGILNRATSGILFRILYIYTVFHRYASSYGQSKNVQDFEDNDFIQTKKFNIFLQRGKTCLYFVCYKLKTTTSNCDLKSYFPSKILSSNR